MSLLGWTTLTLLFIAWTLQEPSIPQFTRVKSNTPIPLDSKHMSASLYYPTIDGTSLHAWFATPGQGPTRGKKWPLVVMAHGFSAQKDFGIPAFANEFLDLGFAVLAFDYRTFGGSDGEPRNVVHVQSHLEDWEASLDYVFTQESLPINKTKVAIWGSSFAGGHVIVIGATSKHKSQLKAIISQVPFVDGIKSLMGLAPTYGILPLLQATGLSIKDLVRRSLGLSRQYIPLLAEGNNELRVLPTDDCYAGYGQLLPKEPLGGWKNQVAASIFLEFPLYRPTSYASEVVPPVLLLIAENDALCDPSAVRALGEKLKNKELVVLPKAGHFDPYVKPRFAETIEAEKNFMLKHLN